MHDLRSRFASLDAVAVPDLRAEIDRRAVAMSTRPSTRVLAPRVGWRASGGTGRAPARGPFGLPALALLALLVLALVASLLAGAGWWNRSTVLVPSSSQQPIAIVPIGDCEGAARTPEGGDPPPFRGWSLGPGPGFLTSAQPGSITALWHEPAAAGQQAQPPLRDVTVVELDPVQRVSCRLMTPLRIAQANPLEGTDVESAAWTRRGDAFATYRTNVENDGMCCAPGELLVWWPGGFSVPVAFDRDYASLVWSNSGSWLAVGAGPATTDWAEVGPHRISLYPADGGAARDVRMPCDPCVMSPAHFSPNDTGLAVTWWRVNETRTDGEKLLAVVDVATGIGTDLDTGLADLDVLGWADDGTILAFQGGWRLLAIPVDAPASFRVVAELPLRFGSFEETEPETWIFGTWSPDLSSVAYTKAVEDGPALIGHDIFVLDVRSGTARHVAHDAEIRSDLVWAPDNRTIAYSVFTGAFPEQGVTLKVVDALEGDPVAIGLGLSPVAWRPVWR